MDSASGSLRTASTATLRSISSSDASDSYSFKFENQRCAEVISMVPLSATRRILCATLPEVKKQLCTLKDADIAAGTYRDLLVLET